MEDIHNLEGLFQIEFILLEQMRPQLNPYKLTDLTI